MCHQLTIQNFKHIFASEVIPKKMSQLGIALLEEHGIRCTANRIIVLDALLEASRPVSMKEIEEIVVTLDKSSIFRCLTLMKENRLLHVLDGGPEGVRYEVCRHRHDAGEEDSDEHVHFHCEECGRTFCFESIGIPSVPIPDGYSAMHAEYTLKGICPDCQKSKG